MTIETQLRYYKTDPLGLPKKTSFQKELVFFDSLLSSERLKINHLTFLEIIIIRYILFLFFNLFQKKIKQIHFSTKSFVLLNLSDYQCITIKYFEIMKNCLILLLFISLHFKALSQVHRISLKNTSEQHVTFVTYNELGNSQLYSIAPGNSDEIRFDHEYLNILALNNNHSVPYFFFDGDEVVITEVKDYIYQFEGKDVQRINELRLSNAIFKFFQNDTAYPIEMSLLLKQTENKIDSIFLSDPLVKVSPRFKQLTQLYYRYEKLYHQQNYNSLHLIKESYDHYWQQDYNYALESYITAFRGYILNYLPKFVDKNQLLSHINQKFQNEHKEIAMYTSMQMAFYKDKEWFRQHFTEYNSFSKDKKYNEKLSYFKLTDDVSKRSGDIILVNTSKDTLSFGHLLSQLKGKVILLDLWASWCSPCIELLPASNEIEKSFAKNNFQLVYLNLDRELHLFTASSEKYLKGKMNFNIVGNFNSPFAKIHDITYIPRYMIIDKQGMIVNALAPTPDESELKTMIEKYL